MPGRGASVGRAPFAVTYDGSAVVALAAKPILETGA